jgi:hypothetical protein
MSEPARVLVAAVASLLWFSSIARAQEASHHVALDGTCRDGWPTGLVDALVLELSESSIAVGEIDVDRGADLMVILDPVPCSRSTDGLRVSLARGASFRRDETLDLRPFSVTIRTRTAALWLAELIRAELGLGPEPSPPAPTPSAPPTSESVPWLIRGGIGGTFRHDVLTEALGPGADGFLHVGLRGAPGGMLEISVGGSALDTRYQVPLTELRLGFAALVDVPFEPWILDFGVRGEVVHEIVTGAPPGELALFDGKAVQGRLSILTRALFRIFDGIEAFAELEVGVSLAPLALRPRANADPEEILGGPQGTIRLGLAFEWMNQPSQQ